MAGWLVVVAFWPKYGFFFSFLIFGMCLGSKKSFDILPYRVPPWSLAIPVCLFVCLMS